MPALYLSCLLIYCIPFLLSYFGIQPIQSFCIYWEIGNIQKSFSWIVAEREGNNCVYKIRLFLKKLDYDSEYWILDLKKKQWKSHKHWCPFQTISLLSFIHSRLFKQIFLKLFFFKNFSPLQRMFPKLYGSNSIFDVLMTSVYLYCILYYKAAVFNNVLLYLPMCFECLFLCCGEQIPK